jgi:enterochelin esterase-like enzyme
MRLARAAALLGACSLSACAKQPAPAVSPPALAAPAPPAAAAPAPGAEEPDAVGDGDVTIGPAYTKQPELTDRGAPRGRRFEFTMDSKDSKIFRGEDTTLKPEHQHPFTRKVFVYVPAQYKDGSPAPVLVVHDGPGPLDQISFALDNLTISKDPARRLPPFVVVAVANGGSDSKGSQRGLEYDTMSDRLARFVNDEVFPAVLANPEIKAAYPGLAFTTDPWGRGVFGCSSGGAAALSMGWFRPDLFRRLITYSGTFVDQQDDDAPEEATYPFGAWEYHSSMKLVETAEKKPLRIFTHVSDRDLRWNAPEETHRNWVMANQRMAAALKAKGYPYRFVYSQESKHCDGRVFDATLADTLVWAWRGYRAP